MSHRNTKKFPPDIAKARRLLERVKTYTQKLEAHIEKLDKPARIKRKRLERKEYLTEWYTSAFDDDDTFLKFFIKYAYVDHFRIKRGFYVGKRSMHVDTATTEWLESNNIWNDSTEHGNWWNNGYNHIEECLESKGIKVPNSKELLDELTKFKKDKRENPEDYNEYPLLDKLVLYIHMKACKPQPDILWEADKKYSYVIEGIDFVTKYY